uniref:ATP synthase subunit a n=1 Tax=Taiwanofungus camphoratus TaxID=2696576 RepID=A0A4D6SU51_TAICA|nr:ATP synthase F0 subunit a [Taiwanofungus camphoratus]QCG70011.1 ATP synthase F0 subunit a [Taiwanofungus camphoratus]UKQ56114.1 ATP synthase F0 subunit a [Taiwanofungus camphoratus]WRO45212.1 ATP synthase F0 subunit a [Taiwanofungus sp. YW-2023a]
MLINSHINQNNLIINSPLEQFEVSNLLGFNAPILGYLNISLTNLALYSLLVLFIIVAIHYMANNENKLVPSKWSIALESLFASINSMVREQLGKEVYLPFIYSLFFFILIANLTGNIPYSFTITTSIMVSIGFSFTILIAVTILGLSIHKLHFFSYFVPSGTPLALVPLLVLIELVSYLARAFSLGIRLFANVVAGHTLMKILATFLYQMFSSTLIIAVLTLIPFTIFLAIVGLELAVSIIQAYVFTILTCSYIKDAIELH